MTAVPNCSEMHEHCPPLAGGYRAGGSGGLMLLLRLLSEMAVEDLPAGTVLVKEAELSRCVEDVFKVRWKRWVWSRLPEGS